MLEIVIRKYLNVIVIFILADSFETSVFARFR